MGLFPETPKTVLRRLSELRDRTDESAWMRFAELYRPAIREFIRISSPALQEADVEDVSQDVFSRLVSVFREGSFDPAKGSFRNYLSTVVRRILIDRARRQAVRFASERALPLSAASETAAETVDAAVLADLNWRIARHQAAVTHVFAKSALGEHARRIYVLNKTEGLTAAEIAKRLGEKSNAVRAILSRVEKMISAVEGEYD